MLLGRSSYLAIVLSMAVLGSACKRESPSTSAGSASSQPPAPAQDIDSKDILARTDAATDVDVKHVLIGWQDLAASYRGRMDPRAAKRTNAEAVTLAQDIASKLRADPTQIDALVKQYSEDPGSQSGEPYNVKAETPFVPEFKKLALRLKPNEVGIVKTSFGYHVMLRVAPPPPDPLESADILARPLPAGIGTVQVQHVLISWQGAPAAKQMHSTQTRSKADADKIAQDVLAKVKAGGDMPALMKEFSEDPGSKDNGRIYDVAADTPMVEPFKNLSLRLNLNEAGLVKSSFGWHIIKRVPPPPPDTLESAEILARQPTTQKAKVKHILLGWTGAHTEDPRGVARDRPTLEKLVAETVAKLKGGAKIEPLMAELSEDPGSAKTGISYDATPDAQLVPPFKNLSLRLNVGEVGVVKTDYGMHIIQRVE